MFGRASLSNALLTMLTIHTGADHFRKNLYYRESEARHGFVASLAVSTVLGPFDLGSLPHTHA